MAKPNPKQIEPAIDPNAPTGPERHSYFILRKPQSPSVTPPNAMKVTQYHKRSWLPGEYSDDERRPWGQVLYQRELTYSEILEYDLLPLDPEQIALFDLWVSLDKDKDKMSAFFVEFFENGDTARKRVESASRLVAKGWTLKKAIEAIKRIV